MIEITDQCNVVCNACYKKKGDSNKGLDEIRRDIDAATTLRQLHTITISGGEPTLHPQLPDVIQMIKERGFHSFLLTNGLLTDEEYMCRLKESGLDSILFHVDLGQNRPDLPAKPEFTSVRRRLEQLIGNAVRNGIDASMSFTVYDSSNSLKEVSDFFINSPDITFMFISRAVFTERPSGEEILRMGVNDVIEFYESEYGVEPFANIPSSVRNAPPMWVSFFVPIVYGDSGTSLFRYRSNVTDLCMMQLARMLRGGHIHKTTQNGILTSLRVAINAISRFRFGQLVSFLLDATARRSLLRHKMIVYDNGPVITGGGKISHCEYCPTAIVRDGRLLPCCTADYPLDEKERMA